ncbi:MAG: aminotransferase class I/II-fold pyridoxal phosphate-dependent enzyme, partial [bacterium]|nr:aminotransferase class I/II-fold pyridoxal phosphate-dependent enzyme [bacterium]
MALESSDLVLHDKAIVMPAATVDQLLAEVSVLTRVHLQGMLPVKLARGVPPFVNDELIRLAEKRFLHGNEVGAYATYAGDRHEEVPEPNAFRGDAEYIDHVVATLKQEWGLEISPTQLITGTAGGQDMITEILDHHILDRNRSVATSNRTFDRTNRHIDRRLRNGQGERRVIQRSSDGINVDDMVRFYREANQSGKNGVFFVVADGSNPDGYTAKIAELAEICDLAHGYNGEVLIDAAYAGLYFDEADKTDYSKLQKYIDEGVLTIVFTSTKEGGKRGAAYAIGGEDLMGKIFKSRCDQRLSPSYEVQA